MRKKHFAGNIKHFAGNIKHLAGNIKLLCENIKHFGEGCVYVGGVTFGTSYLTLKFNNNGMKLWSRVQPGFEIGPMHQVIKIDKERNVYMSYISRSAGDIFNFAMVKYYNNGVQKWIAEYNNGGLSSLNHMYDLTIDKAANIYVTGQSGISIATVKFVQTPTSINPVSTITPPDFTLEQNYPNPFNPKTIISYQLTFSSEVKMKIYNVLGIEIETLVDEKQNSGSYSVTFDVSNYPSGVYLYTLSVDGNIMDTKRMLLLK